MFEHFKDVAAAALERSLEASVEQSGVGLSGQTVQMMRARVAVLLRGAEEGKLAGTKADVAPAGAQEKIIRELLDNSSALGGEELR